MYSFRVSGALYVALALIFAACGGDKSDNENRAPVAHITALSEGIVDREIRVDGSGSVAHSGAALAYTWTLQKPEFSSAELVGADEPVAIFRPDVAGDYLLSLVVASGKKTSAPANWTITVHEDPNQPPVANAGSAAEVHVGRAIRLDGTQSHDPDGQIKGFRWSLEESPEGSVAALDDETSARPTFVPDQVGDYTFRLVVTDGLRESVPARVVVSATNATPVVTVGALPSNLAIGDTVHLAISASDPDHDPITYQWTLDKPSGSNAALNNATVARPSFVIDRTGEYVATVTVSDPWKSGEPVRIAVVVNNRKPVANAGNEMVGWIGEPVTLSGTAMDPDGHGLEYTWTLTGPEDSTSVLQNDTTLTPTFIPDVPGIYTASLVAKDGMDEGTPSVVNVVVRNRMPTVRIGLIPVQNVGGTVQLQGIGADADGHALIWEWSLLERPEGSAAALNAADRENPTVSIDRVGIYKVQVRVHDGYEWSEYAITRFEAPNRLPVVNAGVTQTVNLGDVVSLSGTASDLDNQELTYAWTFASRPSGSAATLSNPDSLEASFAPDKPGTWNLRLSVNDGLATVTSDVVITVQNRIPVASAGTGGQGFISEAFNLVGTGTDEDPGHQDILTYRWTLPTRPTGSTASVTNNTKAQASFTPDKPGTYVARLVVSDGFDSHQDEITITVENRAPSVDAGLDKLIHVGDTFTTSPTFTDPDKQTPTWTWTLAKPQGSNVTLTNANKDKASFIPDQPGTYVLTVVASDGFAEATDTVTVTVHARPIAVVDDARTVLINTLVNLDGSRSSDPNGSALTWQWTLTKPSGSTATLANATTATPSFTPDKAGAYTATLVVTNVNGGTGTKSVVITARLPNVAPVANAGADVRARVTDLVTLDGSASKDSDGTIQTYAWAPEAPYAGVTLTDASLVKAKFVADTAGVYTVNLTVTDNEGATHTDSVVVTIVDNLPPVVTTGGNKSVFVDRGLLLTGTATDPESDAIASKVWTIEGANAGQATLVPDAADPSKATFTARVDGVYTLRFSATDARGAVGSATMTVVATWEPPSVKASANPSTVKVGDVANLVGEAADSYGGQLVAHYWRVISAPAGSTATIVGDNQAAATFAPDKAGFYVLMFGAEDRNHQAAFAAVTLQATSSAPVANIVAPDRLSAGDVVAVSGSNSTDTDGTIVSWQWTFSSTPAGSAAVFANAAAETTSFVADKPGTYGIRLTVTDNAGLQASSDRTVIATAAPIADAGPDRTGETGTAVTLDGSQSSDPMGGTLTWQWTLAGGETGVTLSNATTSTASLLATEPGIYTVTLTVTNGAELSATDTVTVLITRANRAPVPTIDEVVDVAAGDELVLTATAVDPEDDDVTFAWTIEEGPEGHAATLVADELDGSTAAFTGDLVGQYVIALTVADEHGNEATTTVTVTVIPQKVTVTVPPTVTAGEAAVLEATVPNMALIEGWSWSLVGASAGVTLEAVADLPNKQAFTASTEGVHTVKVEATDAHGNVATVQVEITVIEAAPGIPGGE